MNTPHPDHPEADFDPEATASNPQGDPPRSTRERLDDLSRDLTEALRRGGRDARRQFEEGFPKVKSDLAKGLHDLAYAVGYASTFGAEILREATPDSLQRGFREGAESGRRAADRVVRERRERKEGRERESTPETRVSPDGPEEAWV